MTELTRFVIVGVLPSLLVACAGRARTGAPTEQDEPPPPPPALASACTESCSPRVIAEGRGVEGLTADEGSVYWVEGGDLVRLPREGGQPHVLLRKVDGHAFVQDDMALYVCTLQSPGSPRTILRVPKDGSTPQTVATVSGVGCDLAVDDEHVYFTAYDARRRARGLYRTALEGGGAELIAPDAPPVGRLAAGSDSLYWATIDRSKIVRFEKTSGAWTVISEGNSEIGPLVVGDEEEVYWATPSRIHRRPIDGETELVATHVHADDLFVGPRHLFMASERDRWVGRVRVGSDEVELLSTRPAQLVASAVVGDELFWVAREGEVDRVMTVNTCSCGPPALTAVAARPSTTGPAEEPPCRFATRDSTRPVYVMFVRDLSPTESDDLSELPVGEVPPGDPRALGRFGVGDVWTVVTESGVARLPARGFGVYAGASEAYYEVHLEAPPNMTDRAAIVLGRGVESSRARLVPVTSIDLASVVGRRIMEALRARAGATGLAGIVLSPRDVAVVSGRFPQPHAYLVAVRSTVPRAADEDDDFTIVSALLFTDAQGNVTSSLADLGVRLEEYTPRHLVDIDADDFEEVHVSSRYYEGNYEHIILWEGSTPEVLTIAGDGA